MKHQIQLAVAGILAGALFCSCRSNLGYTDAELVDFNTRPGSVQLPFVTEKGKQLAFYVAPGNGSRVPETLVMLFPGIGSRALDRLDWAKACPDASVGFLLIDYPGRGRCEGVLRPSRLAGTTDPALATLATHLGVSRASLLKNLRVAGHSFGCGAALQFAARTPVRSLVLLAPFTTMKRALFRKMGPLAWLIPDNLDNRENLRRVLSAGDVPEITIIHGRNDSTIPISMGETLAAISPETVHLITVENGTHVSILTESTDDVFTYLLKLPGPPKHLR